MAQLPLIFNLNYQRIWLADLGNALMPHTDKFLWPTLLCNEVMDTQFDQKIAIFRKNHKLF